MLGWKMRFAEDKELQMIQDSDGGYCEIKFEIAAGPVAIYRFCGTKAQQNVQPLYFNPFSTFEPCDLDPQEGFTDETQDVSGWIVSVANCRYRVVQIG